jgi:hypothetical protein
VVVLDLHDIVTGGEGSTEPLYLPVPGQVQCRLEFDVERSGADTTPVHRTQHLDIAYGVEAEPPGDARLNEPGEGRVKDSKV